MQQISYNEQASLVSSLTNQEHCSDRFDDRLPIVKEVRLTSEIEQTVSVDCLLRKPVHSVQANSCQESDCKADKFWCKNCDYFKSKSDDIEDSKCCAEKVISSQEKKDQCSMLCDELSVLEQSNADRKKSIHSIEENNNCKQSGQMNRTDVIKIFNKNDLSNDQINQDESANQSDRDEQSDVVKTARQLNKRSIIYRTIIETKCENDDHLIGQGNERAQTKLSLIRNFFRFKQNAKKSVLERYQFKNQSSLDANLIESQINSSIISAPVISKSNNLTNRQTKSTCLVNHSTNHSPTATSVLPSNIISNSGPGNNIIVFTRTDSQTDNMHHEPIEEREMWSKKTEFLLAVIGFAVDLGNVWRFPYICYRNGGGAFLIPYLLMVIFGGLPLFYLELALGQYYKNGCLTLWKSICPMMKGIGYAICFIDLYMGMYYNTIISWALYYFLASFTTTLPWTHCSNSWNTDLCRTVQQRSLLDLESAANFTSPSQEFFERSVLEIYRSSGIDDIGPIKPSLAGCLAFVFLLVYFSLWKGVKSTGKMVYFTAIMPYILLTILLIRGLTLDGSMDGIRYYLYPEWSKLLEINVWIDAATQTFFSLGPGFGTLLALSSYNKFNNNCYKDAIITSTINCFTSILSGFVIFSVLGFMAKMAKKDISNVAADGPGLVFIVYPEAISTMKFSWFWSLLFFMMLITLGLDSTFGGLEAMITGLCDEYPSLLRKNREIFVFLLILFIYVCALPTCTFGGNYIVNLLDTYGTQMALLFVVLLESIAISWMYGSTKIARQIEEMHGHKPGKFWTYCWRYISPIFLLAIFISAIVSTKGLVLQKYVYPSWSITLGWAITCSSMICVPIYIIYLFFRTEGSFCQRLIIMITPIPTASHHQVNKPTQPSEV